MSPTPRSSPRPRGFTGHLAQVVHGEGPAAVQVVGEAAPQILEDSGELGQGDPPAVADAAPVHHDEHVVARGASVGKFAKTLVAGWYRATLNSAVYPLINPAGDTEFRLRFTKHDNDDTAADYLAFYTGNSTEANRPDLIITYYVP
jgi:hypothetical protein